MNRGGQQVVCRQVVGVLARRIVCRVKPGARVSAGQRFGVMKFGSRVDLYLPPGTTLRVTPGQRVRSGESVLAVLPPATRRRRLMEPGLGPRAVRMPPPAPPDPAAPAIAARRPRRGIAVLPSLITLGNMFCGYACVVYAMRGEFETAAPFIGIAVVLDMLDGRIARMTGTASEFGVQFDSMADVISFGMAPAILAFSWGLSSLGRLGWAAAFLFVTAAALRLARFNVQAGSTDKRYFIGMPSPAAAGIVASTVYAFPARFSEPHWAAPLVLLWWCLPR